jgi:hypothetical protein
MSTVLIGHPKLKNDLRFPKMEEFADDTTIFEFGRLRDRQRDYNDWLLRASPDEHVMPDDVVAEEAATPGGFLLPSGRWPRVARQTLRQSGRGYLDPSAKQLGTENNGRDHRTEREQGDVPAKGDDCRAAPKSALIHSRCKLNGPVFKPLLVRMKPAVARQLHGDFATAKHDSKIE